MSRYLAVLLILLVHAAAAEPRSRQVDLYLILAADRSGSMPERLRLAQRRGFAAAFRDETLYRSAVSGPEGRIAVIYFEWSGPRDQQIIVPWTVLETRQDMTSIADRLDDADITGTSAATSISGALAFAQGLLIGVDTKAPRVVVDISSNGREADGAALKQALRRFDAFDATINGLVLPESVYGNVGPYDMLFMSYDGPLAKYFRAQVISGPGSFAIEVENAEDFRPAILRKLVREVAWAEKIAGGPG